MITIHREKSYADKFRAYKVILDGQHVGNIKNGGTFDVEASKGNHSLKLKIDWGESPTVEFTTEGGQVSFECGGSLKGIKAFFWIYYITLGRKNYIWLQQV